MTFCFGMILSHTSRLPNVSGTPEGEGGGGRRENGRMERGGGRGERERGRRGERGKEKQGEGEAEGGLTL